MSMPGPQKSGKNAQKTFIKPAEKKWADRSQRALSAGVGISSIGPLVAEICDDG